MFALPHALRLTAHVLGLATLAYSSRPLSAPVSRIDRPTVWRAADVHELSHSVIIEAGGTLVIEAGARIEARPGASIEVTREGRLVALGTALQPIVMTCTSTPKYEGCWDGVTLKGAAELNFGTPTSPAARGTGAAGCRESAPGEAGYGGCDPADSSGALRYVRIEYAARGLQLLGVGSRTVVDLVQVNRSGGDGVTIIGGSADVRHLFLTANQGYGLSWRSGWRGRGQFITVQQDGLTNLGGISGSNEGATPTAFNDEPRSAPTLLNVTVISPFSGGGSAPAAVHLRRGTSGVLRNVLIHTAGIALDIDDARTCQETVGSPRLTLTNVVIANTAQLGNPDTDPLSCEPYASPNVEAEWLADPLNSVAVVTDPLVANALIRNATDLTLPDLRPSAGGIAVTNPLATPPNDGFFDVTAAYSGAVPANLAARNGIPWYSGWTVPAPVAPLPGVVSGIVSSPTRGPIADAVVRAAFGREITTSTLGAYSFGLPAGDHLLTAAALPIGCGAAPRTFSLASGGASTINFTVDCNSVASLAVGTFHGCAVSSAGQAQCWGGNEYGMLGDGTNVGPRTTPVLVTGSNTLDAGTLSSGYTHSCALRSGRAVCWGLNFFAALGVGTAGLFANQPVTVGNASTPSFVKLSAGGYHTCGLTAAGAAWCWGWNQDRQTGQPTSSAELLPIAVAAGPLVFTQITAGESHTCALTAAGEAYCWGGNGRGELGSDPAVIGTQSATPVLVPGGHVFASIDAGTLHTCGVTTAGAAYCWGSQEYGQLGNGVVGAAIAGPVPVSGGNTYLQISAGGQTTCGVTTARVVQCWGSGLSGVLGDGTTTATQSTPVPISGTLVAGGVVVNLSEPPGATACAWTTAGDAFCWGAGASAQLGNGTLLSSTVPVQVLIRGPN
jgi:Regulator of chromosome condensation (RCC1) repeat